MKPTGKLKLVSELLDLPILDKDGRQCGVVDDVELAGQPGKKTVIKALLVGPGAYRGRMRGWAFAIVRAIAGDRITRVPFAEIDTIHCVVTLKCTASEVGLHAVENRVRRWIPRRGAL
jgi:sporulation protein YlmC with PRC-barrel domain